MTKKRKFIPTRPVRPGATHASEFKPAEIPTPAELEAADAFAMGAK